MLPVGGVTDIFGAQTRQAVKAIVVNSEKSELTTRQADQRVRQADHHCGQL